MKNKNLSPLKEDPFKKIKDAKANVKASKNSKPSFTRGDIVDYIERFSLLDRDEVNRLVQLIFHLILVKCRDGHQVKIQNFGTFFTHKRPRRRAFNMHTREEVPVSDRQELKFHPTIYTKQMINPGIVWRGSLQSHWDEMEKLDKELHYDPYGVTEKE